MRVFNVHCTTLGTNRHFCKLKMPEHTGIGWILPRLGLGINMSMHTYNSKENFEDTQPYKVTTITEAVDFQMADGQDLPDTNNVDDFWARLRQVRGPGLC